MLSNNLRESFLARTVFFFKLFCFRVNKFLRRNLHQTFLRESNLAIPEERLFNYHGIEIKIRRLQG